MALSIQRYVSITSGVGGAAALGNRLLTAQLISGNNLIPTGQVLSFGNLNDVATYFGSASQEYAYAEIYFDWTSKNVTAPTNLQFIFWPASATAPLIFGLEGAQAYTSYTGQSAGSFTLTMGAYTTTLSSLDFTSATSLADVAAVVEDAIQAYSDGGTLWTSATVTWDSTTQQFNLVGGASGAAAISVTAGTGGSDVAGQIGWLSPLAIFSAGAAALTITNLLTNNAEANNNFGTFAFLQNLSLDEAQVVEAATWNDGQNNTFLYSVPVTSANAAAWSAALAEFGGTTLTLSSGEFSELIPMMILAATDYSARNSVQNYMYQLNFINMPASVTIDSVADTYDGLRINYYGNVQQAGNYVSFYQRGAMMGGTSDAVTQNVYANEMWFKDAATVALMNLLLALPQIPANTTGNAMVLTQLQSIIDQALYNGVIEVGKTLTSTEQLYITQITGDPNAWLKVQNIGYWVDAEVETYLVSSVTNYKIVYTLVYSKNDVINLIQGRDILI